MLPIGVPIATEPNTSWIKNTSHTFGLTLIRAKVPENLIWSKTKGILWSHTIFPGWLNAYRTNYQGID